MISRDDADLIRAVTGRVIRELRNGAQSAESARTELTYADGWHAAATLAGLAAADAMREQWALRSLLAPRVAHWDPRARRVPADDTELGP